MRPLLPLISFAVVSLRQNLWRTFSPPFVSLRNASFGVYSDAPVYATSSVL